MGKDQRNRFLRDAQQVNGLLDKGCTLEGKLTFDGVVQINGGFRGEVFSDGTLIVGPDAHVSGRIVVDTLIVDGCVEGELEIKTKIVLNETGRLVANVTTAGFVMQDGGQFQGNCQMPGARAAQEEYRHEVPADHLFGDGEKESVVN